MNPGGPPLKPGVLPNWPSSPDTERVPAAALLTIVLVIATAGLVYELVIASVASYLLGDSVRQFSLIIGIYLSALGLGAYLSKFIDGALARIFVDVELAAALVGGLSAPGLFLAHSYTSAFGLILYTTVILVGVLVGLELPLLLRLLERRLNFKDLIARALTFDYFGALIGSLAFSFWLVPKLGLMHTSIACGLLNGGVGLLSTWLLPRLDASGSGVAGVRLRAVATLLVLLLALLQSDRVTELTESVLYPGRILVAEQSHYQRIVLTERGDSLELYLNGNLQFSSRDEHRYHEALVHPAMASAASHRSVLVGGGGDGLAVREVLRWPGVERVTLVDLDERMTELGANNQKLRALNKGSLSDERVVVINQDAMIWFEEHEQPAPDAGFDVILLDFPDPTNYSLGKLYSKRFYLNVKRLLAEHGSVVVQASSPLFARSAFWCVDHTMRAAGLNTRPYHAFVPSFGEWGFVLAHREPFDVPAIPQIGLRYLRDLPLPSLFHFPPDMDGVQTQTNLLNNQALVGYYLKAWARFN